MYVLTNTNIFKYYENLFVLLFITTLVKYAYIIKDFSVCLIYSLKWGLKLLDNLK